MLVQTAGFKRLEEYAKGQVDRRIGELLDPQCTSVDFTRGECAGITLFARIPAVEIERLDQEIKILSRRIEGEHNESDND